MIEMNHDELKQLQPGLNMCAPQGLLFGAPDDPASGRKGFGTENQWGRIFANTRPRIAARLRHDFALAFAQDPMGFKKRMFHFLNRVRMLNVRCG